MNIDLEQCHQIGKNIEYYIRPATFPLAVKIVRDKSDVNFPHKRPSTDLHLQNFVCQNFKMSRTYGWTMLITEKDINCKIARMVYRWDVVDAKTLEEMKKFPIGLYAKNAAANDKFEKHLYGLDKDFHGLAISPLSRSKIIPDVVLIYCLPAQAMRFIQAYLYVQGGVLEFTAAGRVGSCHEGITKPLKTGKPQLVMLGNGDRIWGGAQDSEVLFSCPVNKLEILIEGLAATHKAGLRYPIPTYMNYAPGFQESFENKAWERAGGTIAREQDERG
jgi:uncharacterized protein (DUF169 family)